MTGNGVVAGNIIDNATLTFASPTAQTYGGVISGAGALNITGSGTLTLTGASTCSGTTTISAGSTLQVGNGGAVGALGSGNIVDNGTLIYNLPTSGFVPLPSFSGSGNLSVISQNMSWNGNINLGGSQSFTQAVAAGTGSLYVGFQADGAATVLTGSSISIVGDVGKPYSNGNTLTLDTSAANGPITLNISLSRPGVWFGLSSFTANSGTGTISVVGTGYTGSGTGSTLTTNGGWYVTPVTLTGGIVNISSNVVSGTAVTINPSLTGTVVSRHVLGGHVVDQGRRLARSTLTGSNTYTGVTIVNAGTLAAVVERIDRRQRRDGQQRSATLSGTGTITARIDRGQRRNPGPRSVGGAGHSASTTNPSLLSGAAV